MTSALTCCNSTKRKISPTLFALFRLTTNRRFVTFRTTKLSSSLVFLVRIEPFSSNFQQETTSKILHLSNPLRFINVSKEGTVGLWTSNLNFEKSYSIADDTDENSHQTSNPSGQNRRRLGTWISDAIFMSDVNKLILASTGRDLRFFTVSNETFMEDFHLYGNEKLNFDRREDDFLCCPP